jgi:hypothetical protein
MYPSGQWEGFWVQGNSGRQPMTPFFLTFTGNQVTGRGKDIIGPFVFAGEFEEATGQVRLIKQYLGKHSVLYIGQPDGEGSIQGTWHIGEFWKGPFLIRPAIRKPSGNEPIQEIG